MEALSLFLKTKNQKPEQIPLTYQASLGSFNTEDVMPRLGISSPVGPDYNSLMACRGLLYLVMVVLLGFLIHNLIFNHGTGLPYVLGSILGSVMRCRMW